MDRKHKNYEGMFLLASGNPDFHSASEPVRNVLERSDAEVLALNPWDDRKLAYDIKGHHRGLYVLTYFKADPERISEIEHDSQLDERILRMMIVRRDQLTDAEIATETPAVASARKSAETLSKREAEADKAEAEQKDAGETPTPEPAEAKQNDASETPEPVPASETGSEGQAPTEDKAPTETPQPLDEAQAETPTIEEKPETT